MTPTTDQPLAAPPSQTDLGEAVHRVLQDSVEPLTLSKIRSALPAPHRGMDQDQLGEYLHRQAAAKVVYQYPKYRSQQDRFWDRPMPVHVAALLRTTLEEKPLPWSELRRKLPSYAVPQAEEVLQKEIAQGRLYRHPRVGRGGERFGAQLPDPKDYLRSELGAAFQRLEGLGFSLDQLREGALELLHDEEWSLRPEPVVEKPADEPGQAAPIAHQPHRQSGRSPVREEAAQTAFAQSGLPTPSAHGDLRKTDSQLP